MFVSNTLRCFRLLGSALLLGGALHAADGAESTAAQRHPFLVSGILTHAVAVLLPAGIIARCGEVALTEADVEKARAELPRAARDIMTRDPLPLVERSLTTRMLAVLATEEAKAKGLAVTDDQDALDRYFERIQEETKPSDVDLRAFYDENQGAFGGMPFAQMKSYIAREVAEQQRDAYLQRVARELGTKRRIEVSATWLDAQVGVLDNAVDRLRGKGKPVLVVFGAASCCGPDRMVPIVEQVRKESVGSAEVLYVDARREQGLAIRHGVAGIPTILGFDARGQESMRRQGAVDAAALTSWIQSVQPVE